MVENEGLVAVVREAGIVGAGGAGFPTHVKINTKADFVIINGAECEPLLRVDQLLMACGAEELLSALQLVVDHVGAKEGVIALKKKYHDAEDALNAHLGKFPRLRLHLMDNFYPAGDEQVIVYEVTGKIVPEGGIPLNVGVIVSNVETMLNIYDAYNKKRPVTHKYLTVTGAVAEKKTVCVPIGITVKEAIDLAGGALIDDYVIVNGGPMMGKLISPHDFITKTVKGLIVLPKGHSLINSLSKELSGMLREAKTACMHCSLCSEVCPRGLLGHRIAPHKLIRIASYGSFCDSKTSTENAFLCCECRLCEYACVMNLQPWKLNATLKGQMAKAGVRNTLNNKPERCAPFREYKKFPVNKLISMLGLAAFDAPAPIDFSERTFNTVSLPLRQHLGVPSLPLVKEGDFVEAGQKIADIPEGKLGSPLHASISGTVAQVTDGSIVIKKV